MRGQERQERQERRKLLEHLPEELGDARARKDAEFSLESDHGLFHLFTSRGWYDGK